MNRVANRADYAFGIVTDRKPGWFSRIAPMNVGWRDVALAALTACSILLSAMLGWYATELSSAKAKVEVVSSELSNVKVQLQAVTTSLNSLNTFQQEREVKRDQTQERIFQELSDIKRSLDRR